MELILYQDCFGAIKMLLTDCFRCTAPRNDAGHVIARSEKPLIRLDQFFVATACPDYFGKAIFYMELL